MISWVLLGAALVQGPVLAATLHEPSGLHLEPPRAELELAPARAALGSNSREETKNLETRWYGWQLMLVDAAGWLATLYVHPGAGVVMMVLGSPVVHTLHGESGRAGASLGLRVGAPLTGAVFGYTVGGGSSCKNEGCIAPAFLVVAAGGLGLLVVQIVDAVVLARAEGRSYPAGPAVRVVPAVTLLRGGGLLEVGGAF